ncbi:hypothetical protein GCM10022198_23480 [Klugiella xanthotipulae]|uniref:MacB-like protein n=1 Tax=Klugiella xanthotipulae TaxID=244735 RepID=A0A543I5P3_9MICO|nr:hypothetical protein [Klugiella xanthotipulae]TQM65926.1 hypothetical protein FB466_0746 [Klugiella xanthotipulae]
MTLRQSGAIVFLLLLFSFLLSALHVYGVRQEAITREGNKLYTAESIEVRGSFTDISARLDNVQDLKIYTNLSEDGDIRNIFMRDSSRVNFPLHSGRSFIEGESQKALVGAEVVTTYDGGIEYYIFQEKRYEVIGHLGRETKSLLEKNVILNDPALFGSGADEPYILDGSGVHNAFVSVYGSENVALRDGGTNKRTNVDLVSPLLKGFGLLLVVLGCISTGLLVGRYSAGQNGVQHLQGATHRAVFLRRAGEVTLLVAAVAFVIVSAWSVLFQVTFPVGVVLSGFCVQLCTVLTAFGFSFVKNVTGA